MTAIPSGTKFLSVISSVDTTQKRSQSINEESQFYTIEEIAETVTTDVAYKVYVALLTQTGTNAPTAIVLQNTFDNDFVWDYVGIGGYSVANAEITSNACVFFGGNGGTNMVSQAIATNGLITIAPVTFLGQIQNDKLVNYPIEIRVYL